MKAILQINFKKIDKYNVNAEMLETNPKLLGETDKMIKGLCKQIEKYLKDHRIDTSVSYILKDDW